HDHPNIECLPLFNTHTTSSTVTFRQVVKNRDVQGVSTTCQAGCTSPVTTVQCYTTSTSSFSISHTCPGCPQTSCNGNNFGQTFCGPVDYCTYSSGCPGRCWAHETSCVNTSTSLIRPKGAGCAMTLAGFSYSVDLRVPSMCVS